MTDEGHLKNPPHVQKGLDGKQERLRPKWLRNIIHCDQDFAGLNRQHQRLEDHMNKYIDARTNILTRAPL